MTDEKKNTPLRQYLDKQKHGEFIVDDGNSAETCDVVVCAKFNVIDGLVFQDNLIGECSKCGCAIQWRPHAPTKPKRLCYGCVPDMGKGDKMMITPKTALELATYLGAKGTKQ